MCIGFPMRVARVADGTVWCEGRGRRLQLDLALVGDLPDGSWVLEYKGAACRVISEADAMATDAALDALEAAAAGEIDFSRFFPDLIGREPQLPEHLRSKP